MASTSNTEEIKQKYENGIFCICGVVLGYEPNVLQSTVFFPFFTRCDDKISDNTISETFV